MAEDPTKHEQTTLKIGEQHGWHEDWGFEVDN
jgi:hypothetical protein